MALKIQIATTTSDINSNAREPMLANVDSIIFLEIDTIFLAGSFDCKSFQDEKFYSQHTHLITGSY